MIEKDVEEVVIIKDLSTYPEYYLNSCVDSSLFTLLKIGHTFAQELGNEEPEGDEALNTLVSGDALRECDGVLFKARRLDGICFLGPAAVLQQLGYD